MEVMDVWIWTLVIIGALVLGYGICQWVFSSPASPRKEPRPPLRDIDDPKSKYWHGGSDGDAA